MPSAPATAALVEAWPTSALASICGFQFRFGSLSLKHTNLVSQGQDLYLEIGPTCSRETPYKHMVDYMDNNGCVELRMG